MGSESFETALSAPELFAAFLIAAHPAVTFQAVEAHLSKKFTLVAAS